MTNINTFQGDVFIHEYIKHTGDDNNLFGFSGTDTFKIATAGSDRLTVGSDGSVTVAERLYISEYMYHSGDNDTYIRFTDNNIGLYAGGSHKIGINATNTQFYSDIYMTQYIFHYSDNNTYFGFPSNDTFAIYTNSSERFQIDSSGRIYMGNRISGLNFPDVLTIADTRNADNWSVHNTMFKVCHKPNNQNNHYGLSFAVSASRGDGIIQTYNQNAGAEYDLLLQPSGGKVGIATTNPHGRLHIGNGNGAVTNAFRRYFGGHVGFSGDVDGVGNMSIYCQQAIVTATVFIGITGSVHASDERIKKDITDIDDDLALERLRILKPKQYRYKDEITREHRDAVWGFIAQEVRETLPYATQLRTECLPNIYELANVSDSNVITFTNFDTSNLYSNTTVLRVFDIYDSEHLVNIAEVVDGASIRVREDLSEWIGSVDEHGNAITQIETTTVTLEEYEALDTTVQNSYVLDENNIYTKTTTNNVGNNLFVYGEQVDDYVFLRKDAIFTIATSALQAVDRQLQAEKVKIVTLETQVASILTRLDALESA